MIGPLGVLIELNASSLDLDMVQSWIDGARIAAPANQHVQHELDRQQAVLDSKRALIALRLLEISSRN